MLRLTACETRLGRRTLSQNCASRLQIEARFTPAHTTCDLRAGSHAGWQSSPE